jgi:hypothetical protein
MSISIPKQQTEDWREKLARDDKKQRKIKMRNIARDNKEAEIMFKDKQKKLYTNTLEVFPTDSLGDYILEQSVLSGDTRNDLEQARTQLRRITTNSEIADYIIQRLSQDEVKYLLVNFNKILASLKKTNTKLDKDLFVAKIREDLAESSPPAKVEAPDQTPIRPIRPRFATPVLDDSGDEDADNEADMNNMREEMRELEDEMNDAIQQSQITNALQEQEDMRTQNADDAAPTQVGTNQGFLNVRINPSIAQNLTISPANTPRRQMTPQQRRRYDTELRQSGRQRQPNRLLSSGDFETNFRGNGVISGRGLKLQQKSMDNREYIDKFYIEKNKLRDNILSVKYSKNEVPPSQLRPRSISTALRELIEDVIKDNYNEKVYKMLPDDDKRTFKKFVKVLKLPIDTFDDLDKEYQKNYELLKGQFLSGNNSPEIKNALRKYIVEGMNEGKLNRSESMFLLYQLSL